MATTHRDLSQLVDEGKFRMDLLYRLRVLSIELPPLRERPEDIGTLAQHYLLRFAEQQRKRVVELGPRVHDELARYDWPGNIRELANVMESEVSLVAPDTTVLTRLATRLVGRFRGVAASGLASSTGEFRAASTGEFRAVEPIPFTAAAPIVPLVEIEKKAYLHALEKCNQSVARAAEALGVSKVTFYAKLRSWGMHPRDRFDDEGPTSVRRQRVSVTEPAAEPFEPPTRTSATKIPTEK
jgi:DNA-binding NtrC family response regulator